MKEGDTMLSKSLKYSIVLALVLALFGGTAMADNKARNGYHPKKGNHRYQYHRENKWANQYRQRHPGSHYNTHKDYGHRNPPRPVYHQPHYQVSKPHPLAPRILFLGPIPVPVPPPPHEVLNYIAGHR
jgi:hypothetical protein